MVTSPITRTEKVAALKRQLAVMKTRAVSLRGDLAKYRAQADALEPEARRKAAALVARMAK